MAVVSWYYKIYNIILFQKYCFLWGFIFYSLDRRNDPKPILTNEQTSNILQCVLHHEKFHCPKKYTSKIYNFVDSMHYMVLRWGISMYFLESQYALTDYIRL